MAFEIKTELFRNLEYLNVSFFHCHSMPSNEILHTGLTNNFMKTGQDFV